MSTATQHNPNADFNYRLLDAGASKTVYALVTPETERAKLATVNSPDYLGQFRGAWTSKQDGAHTRFFQQWLEWSSPIVDLDPNRYPFYYPTAGASEALRHIIFDLAARGRAGGFAPTVHFFEGEYEGYKAMAQAAGLEVCEHSRAWATPFGSRLNRVATRLDLHDLFFISQPSAIDGNVWLDFNEFVSKMPPESVVVDVTYVGAIPGSLPLDRFNLNHDSIRNVVFSLSKPFGAYYDRIGGVFFRREDEGLFGNKWFKNLTSLDLGTRLMQENGVFDLPNRYRNVQEKACVEVGELLGLNVFPADVYILGRALAPRGDAFYDYLRRPLTGDLRLCLTPAMANMIGTAG